MKTPVVAAPHHQQPRIIPLVVPNGKLRTKNRTLVPTELRTEQRIYLLTRPLPCAIVKQGKYWVASNEEVGIEIPSASRMEAEQTFAEAFNELYEFFVLTAHPAMTQGARAKKQVLESLVQAVYQR
jgi:hypothetical protein